MIDSTATKLVQISLPNEIELGSFTLETVYGRDALADRISADIDEYCAKAYDDGPRSHLGASEIGHECERYLWFKFRWAFFEIIEGRVQRLFNRGHLEEERFIEWLRGIGFTVKQTEVDGKQIRIADCGNHFGGSCDGNATLPTRYGDFKEPLLLEFKTHMEKGFKEMLGSGVQKTEAKHWAQMCMYGFKLGLKYALYMNINKNNDEINVEVLELDWELAKALINKAEKIITAAVPPPRLSNDPSFWQCGYCKAQGICHFSKPLLMNCRSCRFVQPIDNAEWHCNHWNATIPKDAIPNGCNNYQELQR